MRPSSAQVALAALCATAAATAWGDPGESQKPVAGGESEGKSKSPFTEEYAKHVGELLEEWHVPGVAIGIVDGDDIWTEVGLPKRLLVAVVPEPATVSLLPRYRGLGGPSAELASV
jgi:hypothetical protein